MSAKPKMKEVTEEIISKRKYNFKSEEAGATINHNRITRNISGLLYEHFKNRDCCEHFISDMSVYSAIKKTKSGKIGGIYLPDIVIVCNEAPDEFEYSITREDEKTIRKLALKNPTIIIEVLSKGTIKTDLKEKVENYQQIDSLKEYLIIYQDTRKIIRYVKEDTNWSEEQEISEGVLCLDSIEDLKMNLDDIYEKTGI